MPSFGDLARAAYCPRQLYYARRDDRTPPPEATARKRLAHRYPALRTAGDETLRSLPIDLAPDAYRGALDRLAERDEWASLIDPAETEAFLAGRDCRGVADKILDGEPPIPALVSPGSPPDRGVWRPQAVRAVAAAKVLSWEREREIPRALVEYPASAVVREVRLTTRRKAAYREALRTVRSLDGPPPRLRNSGKCGPCEYRETCGVRTRSLKSLLGL
ncbi:CRISPR-associated protein Cas4 [Halegenticoccus soli]|uniref:CRISPR-associated protein Cas4 n=1 Tax=Halegenticoccus soli TaxID=1985678 RepID=UPI000C6E836E|nr:Dna2/Cas4 domain-containing protein [Halegenticoccus soli]